MQGYQHSSMRPPCMTVLAWVLFCSVLQLSVEGARLSAVVPIYDVDKKVFQFRVQWDADNGFCGETSIQAVAIYHGVWVSQEISRELAGGEVLVGDGENMEKLVKQLGFDYTTWEQRRANLSATQRTLENYMVWMKQQIIAGRVVIFGARLNGGDDPWYDHIMPAFGVEYTSPNTYNQNDRLFWTDNYGDYAKQTLGRTSTSSLYANKGHCRWNEVKGGCIPKPVKYVTGLAMGGLLDEYGIMKPLRLRITRWADEADYGTSDDGVPYIYHEPTNDNALENEECPCGAHVMGSFQLDMSNSGVKAGELFTIFRCDGPGSVPANPRSIQDLHDAPNCQAKQFVMPSTGVIVPNQLTHETFGEIDSLSVVYFVCVLGH